MRTDTVDARRVLEVTHDLKRALVLCLNTGDVPWWVRSQASEALKSALALEGEL